MLKDALEQSGCLNADSRGVESVKMWLKSFMNKWNNYSVSKAYSNFYESKDLQNLITFWRNDLIQKNNMQSVCKIV